MLPRLDEYSSLIYSKVDGVGIDMLGPVEHRLDWDGSRYMLQVPALTWSYALEE